MPLSEAELLKAVRKKDRKAQRMLYEQYRSYWYTICLRYSSNREEASDALQNGLVKIYSNIADFNSKKGSFKSWSSKIIVNENLMLLRKNKSFSTQTSIEEEFDLADDTHGPLENLSAKELTDLISKLPLGYRTVFNLYVMEGLKHSEIATELGISEGSSKSQLSKARNWLKRRLEVLI